MDKIYWQLCVFIIYYALFCLQVPAVSKKITHFSTWPAIYYLDLWV